MKIIDARSGRIVKKDDLVYFGDSDWWRLIDVEESWLSANATIKTPTGIHVVPLTVRFFHPSFFGQKVAFVGS